MVTFDVPYSEPRNRLTNAFRWILAIPHLLFVAVWGYAAELVAVVQWFIILVTGRRNHGIWAFQRGWFGYATRVTAYTYHLFDDYPAFGTEPGTAPVHLELRDEEPADRLTNGLRLIWAIPALIVGIVVGIAVGVVLFVTWWAILFTGKHPRGLFAFTVQGLRYTLQLNAYVLLMTDTYPKWGSGVPAGGGGPIPPPPGRPVPPPPPPATMPPPPPPPQ